MRWQLYCGHLSVFGSLGLHVMASKIRILHVALVAWSVFFWARLLVIDASGPGGHTHYCRVCEAEVQGFDHHCDFLNLCIGNGNYRSFCCFIVGLFSLELYHAVYAATWVSFGLAGVLAALLFGLIAFTAYVGILGLGTYGWVLYRRDLEEQRDFEARREIREKARRAEYEFWLAEHKSITNPV